MQKGEHDLRLASIASSQYGLVTTDQILGAGLSDDSLRRRRVNGSLVPVRRGVYRMRGAPRSWEQDALAGCLAAGRDAVLSHRSAATAWNLDLPRIAQIHVTRLRPASPRTRGDGLTIHTTRVLSSGDRTRVGRLPVTGVARTLVDLSTEIRPGVLARIVDDALCRRLVRPNQLNDTLDRCAARGRTGTRVFRATLEPWIAGAEPESVAECALLRRLAAEGLPSPTRQHPVYDGEHLVARVDFAWPASMTLLEVEGFRWHGGPRSHANDSLRANTLACLGWTVLRTTPAELETSPHAVLGVLRRRLLGGS